MTAMERQLTHGKDVGLAWGASAGRVLHRMPDQIQTRPFGRHDHDRWIWRIPVAMGEVGIAWVGNIHGVSHRCALVLMGSMKYPRLHLL